MTQSTPQQADVIIVGGGLAGLYAAWRLAAADVRVLLLDAAPSLVHTRAARRPGLAFAGLIEHPHRLAYAVGDAATQQIYRFSQRGVDILDELGQLDRSGLIWAALDEREDTQLARSIDALSRIEHPHAHLDAVQTNDAVGSAAMGTAMVFPDEGTFEPLRALEDLARRATQAGATLAYGREVFGATQDAQGTVLKTTDGQTFRSDALIWAANAGLPMVEPFFAEKILPTREHMLRTSPLPVDIPPGRAGYAYTFWRQQADRRLLVGGARWATPHLEVGETDDTVTLDVVQAKLEQFIAKQWPGLEFEVEDRWSYLDARTCDGLPIVGPLPGDPTWLACAGFVGNAAALGLASAEAIVEGLLEGTSPNLPRFFRPERLLL